MRRQERSFSLEAAEGEQVLAHCLPGCFLSLTRQPCWPGCLPPGSDCRCTWFPIHPVGAMWVLWSAQWGLLSGQPSPPLLGHLCLWLPATMCGQESPSLPQPLPRWAGQRGKWHKAAPRQLESCSPLEIYRLLSVKWVILTDFEGTYHSIAVYDA